MKGSSVNVGSSMLGSTSSSLIAGLRDQKRDAWMRFVKVYGPAVYAWCRRGGLQPSDAANVSQDVFVAVLKHLDGFDGKSFRGWLRTITRNKVTDHFRRLKGQPQPVGGSDAKRSLEQQPERPDEPGIESGVNAGIVQRALEQARPDFKEATWEAFRRVVMDGQQPAEVARRLGISVNAVFIAKGRVLRRLRDVLGEDFL